MKRITRTSAGQGRKIISLVMMVMTVVSIGCHKNTIDQKDLRDFQQVNLIANTPGDRPRLVDPTLINAFGIAWSDGGVAWVNSVGGHVSELYSPEGVIKRAPVKIPSRTDTVGGLPCGIVYAEDFNFQLPNGKAIFLFTGFDGVLSGWNGGNNAQRIAAPAGASYTGLAVASNGTHNYIYGANFLQKKIDVWDEDFKPVHMSFNDISLPDGYSPYNIQAVGTYLFVMYGQLNLDPASSGFGHGIAGAGKGFVDVYSTDGTLVRRFASKGTLNLPWGVTMAPAGFLDGQVMDDDGGGHGGSTSVTTMPVYTGGDAGGSRNTKDPVVLVGNFGDGRINVFSEDGTYLGQLQSHKQPIVIDGLWALSFPQPETGIDPARMYFTAGPKGESNGVFGFLIKQ